MNTVASGAQDSAYDPIGAFSWEYAYWAEGPLFVAESYAHLATVTTWPDEMGNADMWQFSGTPSYNSGLAQLNNKPCVDINSGDRMDQHASSPVGYGSHSTCSVVWIGYQPSNITNRWQDDNLSGGGRFIPMVPYAGNHQIFFGGTAGQSEGVVLPGAFANVTVQNGTSDRGYLNGSLIYSGSYGTDPLYGVSWNQDDMGGVILAFYGVWTGGNITDEAGWAAFSSWSLDHYGVAA